MAYDLSLDGYTLSHLHLYEVSAIKSAIFLEYSGIVSLFQRVLEALAVRVVLVEVEVGIY